MASDVVLILYMIVGLYVEHAFVSVYEEEHDDGFISACMLPAVLLLWPIVCIATLVGWIFDD